MLFKRCFRTGELERSISRGSFERGRVGVDLGREGELCNGDKTRVDVGIACITYTLLLINNMVHLYCLKVLVQLNVI